jgi:hypothetical protein
LLVLLIGLGAFFIYVTRVEGRSFQSKLVEFVLGFGNKKYYADEEKFVQFVEMKSVENYISFTCHFLDIQVENSRL